MSRPTVRTPQRRSCLFFLSPCILVAAAGCGGGGGTDGAAPDGGADVGMTGSTDLGMQGGGPDLGAPPVKVAFSYRPLWAGVTAVNVYGGFGQADDWSQPLLKLNKQADGSFAGATQLPAGFYLYLFQAQGDSNATAPTTFKRYVLDPANPGYAACPSAAPTYTMAAANPCSQLQVPQGAAPALFPVKGVVNYDGKAASGYLAVLEREETGSHHFFTNLTVTGADGSYAFMAALGQYRVQVLYPTLEKQTDAERNPLPLQAARRGISASFHVSAATSITPVDMAYHDYDKLMPTGTAKLPTTFHFSVIKGASKATLDIYGLASPTAKDIGDPWFASAAGTMTSAVFDGTFTTMQAKETTAKAGELYYFGTEQALTHTAQETAWTLQSMVLPITFQ